MCTLCVSATHTCSDSDAAHGPPGGVTGPGPGAAGVSDPAVTVTDPQCVAGERILFTRSFVAC